MTKKDQIKQLYQRGDLFGALKILAEIGEDTTNIRKRLRKESDGSDGQIKQEIENLINGL